MTAIKTRSVRTRNRMRGGRNAESDVVSRDAVPRSRHPATSSVTMQKRATSQATSMRRSATENREMKPIGVIGARPPSAQPSRIASGLPLGRPEEPSHSSKGHGRIVQIPIAMRINAINGAFIHQRVINLASRIALIPSPGEGATREDNQPSQMGPASGAGYENNDQFSR